MDIKKLAARLGLTKITVREATEILRPRGGEFEIRARLQNGADWGYCEKDPNGRYRYYIYKELLPEGVM
jgi:hypothetical protein